MNNTTDCSTSTVALAGSTAPGSSMLARAVAVLRRWHQLSRSRSELAALDDYQLRDVGLTRSQAQFEAGQPFFREQAVATLRLPGASINGPLQMVDAVENTTTMPTRRHR